MKGRHPLLLGSLAAALAALVWTLNLRDEFDGSAPLAAAAPSEQLLAQGAYLARAGNCMGCHTARGGVPFAGGRGIETPFGTVFSSNLTPDDSTGLGSWSAAHFRRALHNGRSKNGSLLYPAFPYTNYTQVSREDSDALYAYLRSLPPTLQPRPAHTLRWPFSTQAALAVWRALYFRPGSYQPDKNQSEKWNRGAYLVRGLGHCAACHAARNAWGAASPLDLAGGLIPMQNWYAPALTSSAEAGVADWEPEHIVRLLQDGVSPRGTVLGPMAEVVRHSTQHLSAPDLAAMAVFLKALPATAPTATPRAADPRRSMVPTAGARLYERYCADCHGERGQGVTGAYPALAGNRAVTMPATINLVQVVLNGGYAPATAGNPRPYGMPPFMLVLSDGDVATLLTYLRSSWGNQASAVTPFDVNRARTRRAE